MLKLIQKFSLCLFVMLGLFLPTHSSRAEESAFKPVAIVSLSGYDNFWDSVEKIADLIGYKDSVVATRTIAADVQGLDKSAPAGFLLMTDGDSFLPFGFLPIASIEELEFIGSEDLKDQIEETEDGIFIETEDVKVELLEKEGWLYIFEPGKAALIPEGNPADLLDGLNNEYLWAAKLFGQNLPKELLDNLMAPIRQQMATIDASQAASFDFQLNYFFEVFAEIQNATFGVNVNPESGDLEFLVSVVPVPETVTAETFKNFNGVTTQWGTFFDPAQSVLALAGCSRNISDRDTKFLKGYYGMTFDNILTQLDVFNDDDEEKANVEDTKQIIEKVRDWTNAFLDSKKMDYVFSLTNDAQIHMACTITDGQTLLDALKIGVSLIEKENEDFVKKYIKLASGEYEGYTVSSFSFPFADIEEMDESADVPEYLIDKQAAVILAIKDNALVLLAGLDKKAVSDKFKELAKEKQDKETTLDRHVVLSFENLGKMLLGLDLPVVNLPEIGIIINKMSEAGPDAIVYAEVEKASETEVVVKEVMTSQNFVMIGNIIRAITESMNDEFEEEIEDDLFFDDEENTDAETDNDAVEEEDVEVEE